ncbi:MAG: extracellular solute-binding protein [Candidatus Hydrogenedentes bacterium]|nr:extracellular solute-binding protein [Candidatus Hydrogenedentota bacterium]
MKRQAQIWRSGIVGLLLQTTLSSIFAAPPESATQNGVLRFSYWANQEEHVNMWRPIIRGFEAEYPAVAVKPEWYLGDYGRKLQMVFITNTATDVILMDDEIYPSYGVRGYLEDLRPYIERRSDEIERLLSDELHYLATSPAQRDPGFRRRFMPTSLESFDYRGFLGGLPWAGFAVIMFYNKDLFDRDSIPYPQDGWTWDDFRRVARQLTKDLDGDGRTDQFGTNIFFEFLPLEPLVWSYGGDFLNADNTRSSIQEPAGLQAVRFVYDMKYQDHSIALSGELGLFAPEIQLLTGRLAMVPGASYGVPTLNRVTEGLRWGIAHMPRGPAGKRYTRVTWNGISMYRYAAPDKKEWAWKFIKQMLSDRVQTSVGKAQRGIPVRRELAYETYANPNTPAEEETVLEATEYGRLTPITPRYMELREAITSEFSALNVAEVTGVTPEAAVKRAAPKIDRVLSKDLAEWGHATINRTPSESGASSVFKALSIAVLLLVGGFSGLMAVPPVRRGFRRQWDEAWVLVRSRRGRGQTLEGICFASPWLAGLCLFTAFPILFSIVLSFCEWDPYKPMSEIKYIGLANFHRAFSSDPMSGDPLVGKALYNTLYYAFFAVPLGVGISLFLAVLLNQKIRGITLFRTVFYLPSIVSGVATVILWTFIFDPIFGPLNGAIRSLNVLLDKSHLLAFINLPEPMWLNDPHWAKPSMVLMSLWGAGGAGMLVFLAGLQGVPDQLYEAAELDGAGRLRKFWNITLPMLTPTIYFNLLMGVIGALNVFMQAFILTNGTGGVDYSLLFYVLHLYNKAFVEFEMGYASALAWILFAIIMGFTLLIIRSSALWVYYEGERRP